MVQLNIPPLAEKERPESLESIVGQSHLTAKNSLFSKLLNSKNPTSLLFWGPPGVGKTTLAQIYGKSLEGHFVSRSACDTSISDIKKLLQETRDSPLFHSRLVLFLDEIHRFNKTQQDFFLPFVEKGELILIGATTENPSFSLANALLSRLHIFVLTPLEDKDLLELIKRHQVKSAYRLSEEAKEHLACAANGDARALFNMLENIENYGPEKTSLEDKEHISLEALKSLLATRLAYHDKSADKHYNLISALHKSIRGSDPDAALYWLARMLIGGEDPLYIGRRLIRTAIEDIGLADPTALMLTQSAIEAYRQLGSPEGDLLLAEAVIYLALSPKSNRCYVAYKKAVALAKRTQKEPPPAHIINAPTPLMKEMGFGKGYVYDHDNPEDTSAQTYFPESVRLDEPLYEPVERGAERDMKKRLEYFKKLKESLSSF